MESGRDVPTLGDVKEQAEQIDSFQDLDAVLKNAKTLRPTRQRAVLETIKNTCHDADNLPSLGIGELKDELDEMESFTTNTDSDESIETRYSSDRIDKAKDLLENKHILKKVKTVLDHRIAGEDRTKMGVFLQLLTKDFEEPLMVFGIQKQGEGKSFIAKNVIDLFPDHMVENMTDATKSSIYRVAQNEGPDYFEDKIVYFGEIPEDEDDRTVFQIFRQLVSEGKVSKRLVLDEGGTMESGKLELEGAPAMITTTTDPERIDPQDMSRGVEYTPSMTPEQNKAVREYQNREAELPDHATEPVEIDDLAETIRCALDLLSQEEISITNPFVRDIDEIVPDDADNIKRDYKKILKVVGRVPTYLYRYQRPTATAGNSQETLTTWKDVIRGIWINKGFINRMLEGRHQSDMDVLETIKQHVDPVDYTIDQIQTRIDNDDSIEGTYFTNDDVENWTGVATGTAQNTTRRLAKHGFIYKDSSRRPNRHYLPKNPESETGQITPRALQGIIERFKDAENVRDWADLFLKFSDIEDREKLLDRVGIDEDLPVEVDLGLVQDMNLPTPVYMEFSGISLNQPESVIVNKNGANISIELRGVNETIYSSSDENRSNDKINNSENDEEDLVSQIERIAADNTQSTAFDEVRELVSDDTDTGELKEYAQILSDQFDLGKGYAESMLREAPSQVGGE